MDFSDSTPIYSFWISWAPIPIFYEITTLTFQRSKDYSFKRISSLKLLRNILTASVNTEVEAYNAGDATGNEKAPSSKEEKTAPESDIGTNWICWKASQSYS
jgi:hypothetical protein